MLTDTTPNAPDEMITISKAHLKLLLAAGWLVRDIYYASWEDESAADLADFSNCDAFLDLISERGLATSSDVPAEESIATGIETEVTLSDAFERTLDRIEDVVWPGPDDLASEASVSISEHAEAPA